MTLTCANCNNEFEHSEGEEKWMRERFGSEYRPPRLCVDCRKARRQNRTEERGKEKDPQVKRRRSRSRREREETT